MFSYKLTGLVDGAYSIRARSIALGRDGMWTEFYQFNVRTRSVSRASIIVVVLLIMVFSAIFYAFFYFKERNYQYNLFNRLPIRMVDCIPTDIYRRIWNRSTNIVGDHDMMMDEIIPIQYMVEEPVNDEAFRNNQELYESNYNNANETTNEECQLLG